MTDEQMDAQNLLTASRSYLYSKDIDSGDKIGIIISSLTKEIEEVGEKTNLSNTAQVRENSIRYLKSCQRTGSIPSKIGLARALGMSKYGITRFMKLHPEHSTTQFLEILFDAFAEALSQASLNGSVHPIVAIFLQKALYDMRENTTIVEPKNDPLGEASDSETLAQKYAELTEK